LKILKGKKILGVATNNNCESLVFITEDKDGNEGMFGVYNQGEIVPNKTQLGIREY